MPFGSKRKASDSHTGYFASPSQLSKKRPKSKGSSIIGITSDASILKAPPNFKVPDTFLKNPADRRDFAYYRDLLKEMYTRKVSNDTSSIGGRVLPIDRARDRQKFTKEILPKLCQEISIINEDDELHKEFVSCVIQLDYQIIENDLLKVVGDFFKQLISYKPKFKDAILGSMFQKIQCLQQNEDQDRLEMWLENLIKVYINNVPMMKVQTLAVLKKNVPSVADSLAKPEATRRYIRVCLNICFTILKKEELEDRADLFSFIIHQINKIDKMVSLSSPARASALSSPGLSDDTTPDALCLAVVAENPLVQLLDGCVLEVINKLISHIDDPISDSTQILSKVVLEKILLTAESPSIKSHPSYLNFIFYTSAHVKPVNHIKYLQNAFFSSCKEISKLLKISENSTEKSARIIYARKCMTVLSSFLCYSKVVNNKLVEFMLKRLSAFCLDYIKNFEKRSQCSSLDLSSSRKVNTHTSYFLEAHGHFYSCVQAIIQVLVFRQAELFKAHHQNYEDDRTDTDFYSSLSLNSIFLNRSLNPLLFCTQTSLEVFNVLLIEFHLPDISAKMAGNGKIRAYEALSNGSVSSANAWNPLDWYDIFDPNDLKVLKQTFNRFEDIFKQFVDLVKVKKEILNDSVLSENDENLDIKEEADDNSDSLDYLDSDDSDSFDGVSGENPEEVPILQRLLRRERKISERR